MRLLLFFGLLAFVSAQGYVQSMLRFLNGARRNEGMSPLQLDPHLMSVARRYANYQARYRKGGHRADGRNPDNRAGEVVSENLFEGWARNGARNPRVVMNNWMRDYAHRSVILNDFKRVGIARGTAWRRFGRYHYWVVILANGECSYYDPPKAPPCNPALYEGPDWDY
jgi:uncharacterized protein YkwD